MKASSDSIQAWECFYFNRVAAQTESKTALADGEYFVTAEANKKVVCADNTGASPLAAIRDNYGGAWESLYVVNNADGTVSFRSGANNKYVCAVIDESNQLVARSSVINDWEKFELVKVNDTQFALKSKANGKYVKADMNASGNSQLKAESDSVQAWECFIFKKVGSN